MSLLEKTCSSCSPSRLFPHSRDLDTLSGLLCLGLSSVELAHRLLGVTQESRAEVLRIFPARVTFEGGSVQLNLSRDIILVTLDDFSRLLRVFDRSPVLGSTTQFALDISAGVAEIEARDIQRQNHPAPRSFLEEPIRPAVGPIRKLLASRLGNTVYIVDFRPYVAQRGLPALGRGCWAVCKEQPATTLRQGHRVLDSDVDSYVHLLHGIINVGLWPFRWEVPTSFRLPPPTFVAPPAGQPYLTVLPVYFYSYMGETSRAWIPNLGADPVSEVFERLFQGSF